ncbi:MAG TPA: hypothetical protein VNA89_07110 [Gemmatimonadaceae bacterium]|nr:hypothetical protein [Gemmatimonadaceae bacterium]
MPISRRLIARAGALTLAAATLTACSDSTGPLDLTPDEFASLGESIATQIEGGVFQLTADDATGSVSGPTFSLQSGSRARTLRLRTARPAANRIGFQLQAMGDVGTECGVPSQNPPTDTDSDNVPDNLSITFALPACHYVDVDGTMDLTGVMRLSDPTPGTAGMALNYALDNLRIAFSNGDFSGTVTQNGTASVSATATGLSQMQSWTQSARVNGFPSVGVDLDWVATFAAAEGQTITPGAALPDGVYQPGGSVEYREGNRASSFTVTTVEPLQYSAACAAAVVDGTGYTPFTGGQVRVEFSDAGRAGHVTVSYIGCDFATVQYVAQ